MSLGNTFENDLAKLLFNGTAIANIADNAASSPLTQLWLTLNTADPGEAGLGNSSEATYTGYARKAVARDNTGFAIAANEVSLAADNDFPACTVEPGVAQSCGFFTITVASAGASKIIGSGTITPPIVIHNGVVPRLTSGTKVTFD